jgi:hypothetical protein
MTSRTDARSQARQVLGSESKQNHRYRSNEITGASDQAGSSRSGPKSSAASAASRALSSADGMK